VLASLIVFIFSGHDEYDDLGGLALASASSSTTPVTIEKRLLLSEKMPLGATLHGARDCRPTCFNLGDQLVFTSVIFLEGGEISVTPSAASSCDARLLWLSRH